MTARRALAWVLAAAIGGVTAGCGDDEKAATTTPTAGGRC